VRLTYLGVSVVPFVGLLIGLSSTAETQFTSCDTSCDDSCRISLPFGGSVVEPACKSSCEVHKAAACKVGTPVPNPIPPVPGPAVCGQPFEQITGLAIARCSNWDGRLDDQFMIDRSVQMLIQAGIIPANEFAGVQLRWCPLSNANGLAPQRNRVYLDINQKNVPPASLAALIAHEMTHIRQYRRMGYSDFACTYSRQFLGCQGCQDRGLPLEREAYDFEDQVAAQLQNVPSPNPPPPPPANGLPPGAALSACGCWGYVALGSSRPAPVCASGVAQPRMCQGFCYGGGSPWQDTCR
jgi:hypothetical protein